MDKPDITLRIQTLGRFSISVNGKPVATDWPDETLKQFFCSLLSPLDLYFTWERICRSMWDGPLTPSCRHRLKKEILHPLDTFLVTELGCNPLIIRPEEIRMDQLQVHIDAHEFYRTVLEGLQLSSLVDHSAAHEKFTQANTLYTGSYLPGISGKIIENARHELATMYRTTVLDAMPPTRNSVASPRKKMSEHGSIFRRL